MNEFVLFGTTHLLTLTLIFVASLGFAYFAKSNYSEQSYLPFEIFFGCLLIANELFKPLVLTTFGDYRWTNTVPRPLSSISLGCVEFGRWHDQFRNSLTIYLVSDHDDTVALSISSTGCKTSILEDPIKYRIRYSITGVIPSCKSRTHRVVEFHQHSPCTI